MPPPALLATLIAEHLTDSRQGLNTQFSLADLLRQSVYSRLAGYEDLNDVVRVSADPGFGRRHLVRRMRALAAAGLFE